MSKKSNMSTEKTSRNTVDKTRSKPVRRSRNYCFTLNNPTATEIAVIVGGSFQYVFQEERAASGTYHLQGFIKFKNESSLIQVKKVNDRAHWEVTRNVPASIQYCTKADTRIGPVQTNMDLTKYIKVTKEQKSSDFEEKKKTFIKEDIQKYMDEKFPKYKKWMEEMEKEYIEYCKFKDDPHWGYSE